MVASNDISLDCTPPSLFLFTADVFENMIHLFKGPAPSLWDEEECPDQRQQTKDGEKGISPESSILYQRRCYQALLVNYQSYPAVDQRCNILL